ncbi:helix-turn-helix transcriptional regulator [Alkalihalobacillus trypoxylicola]|uniref:helix-turn-helix transcriptional regulator n=1 Tax=Alkalihalobacillus trypoxylicola TaxID=519424 RepID=UPI000AB95E2E|nr:helix-turn-helix transcriptional regulator [Alkalihalobacillus trypoxylicola]
MNKVKHYRLEKGLTQADLAKLVGVSVYYISRIENNKRTLSTTLAARIAPHLGVSASDLLSYRYDYTNRSTRRCKLWNLKRLKIIPFF